MAEQQHWLRWRLAHRLSRKVEVDLQVIAGVVRWVGSRFAAELGKFMRDDFRNAIHGGFVVAGRFDFDQFADGRDNLVAALVEIGKTALRFRA